MKSWRQRKDEELDAEIRSHLDQAIRDRIERGETPDEARANALREFGNVGLVKEVTREMWGWDWLDDVVRDLRLAGRALRRTPGFTFVAVLSLALGFALTATTMAVVNAYLIRSMPYPAADRLYRVIYAPQGQPEPNNMASLDWKGLSDVVEIADNSAPGGGFYLTDGSYPQEVRGLQAARGSLDALGVRATLGRSLRDEDFQAGAERVVLIGQSLWRERFGGDPNVIGQLLRVSRGNPTEPPEAFRIVGILPPEFRYVREYAREAVEFVVPLQVPRQSYMVRLREGVPVAFAERRITDAIRSFATTFPPNWSGVRLQSIQTEYVAELRPMLFAITVAAGLVLLIVCANVSVLTLLRALRRQKEMAVRVALGAGRKHIVRLLMVEASLICGVAFAGALALTGFTLRLLAPLIEERLGRPVPGGTSALAIDFTVLLIVGGAGLLVALSLAFIPLLTPWARRLADTLRSGGRSGTDGPGMRKLRSSLIALEVAASLALLVGCGLIIRSVVNLVRTDLGYHTEHIVRTRASLPPRTYPDAQSFLRFYDQLTERLTASSNSSYTLTNFVPFYEYPPQAFEVDGITNEKPKANIVAVSDSYFRLFGINIKQGRSFATSDRLGAEPVAVISETLARQLWPKGDAGSALGQRIRTSEQTSLGAPLTVWRTVVGVASDVRQTHTDADLKDIYLPFSQAPSRFGHLYLRTDRPVSVWLDQIRATVKEIDPQVLITGRVTGDVSLKVQADQQLAGPKFLMSLLTGFALFATLLALLGIYGVIAYTVQQREREVAIRIAIGETPSAIIRLFLKHGGLVLAVGIVGGLLGAAAVARLLANQLHGVQPFDALTLLGACTFLALAGLLAIWWPARRAANKTPMTSLNEN